jgi:hypothetical protein
MSQFMPVVGQKFNKDGSLRYFPGSTIICDLSNSEAVLSELIWAQDRFRKLPFAHKFGFLPPASFHMTVFDLICDQVRDEQHWSSLLPLDMPLETADETLRGLVSKAHPPANFVMQYTACFMRTVIGIELRPANDDVATLLRQYREEVSQLTGIRFPNFDTYKFHISLAYYLVRLSPEEDEALKEVRMEVDARLTKTLQTINTGMPKFTLFNDMGAFKEFRTQLPQYELVDITINR